MKLGQQLKKISGNWWILFAAEETKSHRAYEAMFPQALLPRLLHYLERHWPVLLRGESGGAEADIDALWVSEVGTQLETGALARRIVNHTKAAFGKSVPPHWFRDAAATSIAVDNPRHVGDAHLVLGHAGLETTQKHYNQARSLQASRRQVETLARLRASLDGKHVDKNL
jgi:site-specific recombinase XerD